ncbi:MAG TPA: DUF5715 family protein [Gemmatimonadaceae bacterium]|jgi:hypothetical protein
MQPTMFRALALAVLTSTAVPAVAIAQTLRGSPSSVDLMYTTAHQHDLQFLRTPDDIYAAAKVGSLKMISTTNDLEMERVAYPFVLPNTLRFADSLAMQYRAGCGERIVVTSGARPLDKQPRNASPKSVHPTGMAVDFRRPKNPACLTWMRKSLVALEDAHVVEATEERHPAHFHVAVLRQNPEQHIQMAAGDVAPTVKSAANHKTHRSAAKRRKTAVAVASP